MLGGRLAADQAAEVARHLDSCQQCCDSVEAIDKNEGSLVHHLRQVQPRAVDSDAGSPTTSRPATSASPIAVKAQPDQVGAYRIIREIGRGGMGVVYEAEQVALGRSVALKVLPPNLFQRTDSVERFQREAAAAASLHHTNIVPVFEVGCAEGTWFYAMQLINGCGLDVIRKEVRTIRSRVASTDAVARAETKEEERPQPADANDLAETVVRVREEKAVPEVDQVPDTGPSRRTMRHDNDEFDVVGVLSSLGHRPSARTGTNGTRSTEINGGNGRRVGAGNDKQNGNTTGPGFAHYRSVAEIGRQAAGALEHAHQRGVIHRDVKPSNLILDHAGIVWLADFGLAKRLDADLTGTNEAAGTVRYMSPERFEGQSNAGCDVYALGVTLYELLTLERAFSATDYPTMMQQIREVEPRVPRLVDPAIPFDLQTIVLKAMAKDPARRYATAQEMHDDLACYLNGQPISARRVGTLERLWLWSKKQKALATSFLTIAVLIVATAIGSTFAAFHFNKQKTEKTQLADANMKLAVAKTAESKKAKTQRDVAYQNAYFADMKQAHQDWKNGQLRRMLTTLRSYLPAYPGQDVRGWEWYYLLSLAHRDQKTLLDHEGVVTQATWSPDGSRLVSVGSDQTLIIRNVNGALQKKVPVAGVRSFAFNADGSQFATVSGDPVIRIWDSATGTIARVIRTELPALGDIDWKQNRIAVSLLSDAESGMLVLDARSEAVIAGKTLEFHPPVSQVRLSPDGKRLGLLFSGTYFDVFDMETKTYRYSEKFTDLREFLEIQAMDFAWHPAGNRFAIGTFQNGARVYEPEEGAPVPKALAVLQDNTSVDAVAFSPNGQQLLVGNRAQRVDIYDLESHARIESLKGHLNAIRSISQHPKRPLVASSANDGAVKLWNIVEPNAKVAATYDFKADELHSGKSPDGRWTWKHREKKLRITDAGTGRQVAELAGMHRITAVAHFPESKRVLFMERYGDRYVYGFDNAWVVDTESWKLLRHLRPVAAGYPSIAQKGEFAAAAQSGFVSVFDGRTGAMRRFRAHRTLGALDLSPDGKMLATCSCGEVALWEAESGKEIARFFGHRPNGFMPTIHWGNQGRYFATGSIDQTVRVWDARLGEPVQTLRGLQGTPVIGYFGFSADDSRLMAAGPQNVKVWDVRSGRELLSFEIAAFAPKGGLRSFFKDFRTRDTATGFRLPKSAFDFVALKKAAALDDNRRGVEKFRRASLHQLARDLLFNSPDRESREQGMALARRALSLDPANAEYMFTIGLAECDLGNHAEAVRVLRMAAASGLDHEPRLHYLLASSLQSLNENEEAGKAFQKATALLAANEIETEFAPLINDIAAKFIHPPGSASPDTVTVNSLDDMIDGIEDGRVSLREAVVIVRDGGTITFDVEGTIGLKSGPIKVDKSVTIIGPGPDKLTISGRDRCRLLAAEDGKQTQATVNIRGLSFMHGFAADSPASGPASERWKEARGCIFSNEKLMLTNCRISMNHLPRGFGGAFYVGGHVTLRGCSIDSNSARGGGAVYIGMRGKMTVDRCTFTANVCVPGLGGAIRNTGTLDVSQSTFSKNKATHGSAIASPQTGSSTRVDRCTFAFNTGGAIHNYTYTSRPFVGDWTLSNSLFVGNTASASDEPLDIVTTNKTQPTIRHCLFNKCQGGFIDGGNSLVGVDAKLAPLSDNGGPTKTHALNADSPAIDAADPAGSPEFDQRGTPFKRSVDGDGRNGAAPDIGAFEFSGK